MVFLRFLIVIAVADLLLWRRRCGSVTLLVSSTVLWFLLERAGYNLLSFIANVLLLLVVNLFFWAKSASLLNRPLPPIPDMEVPEEFVVKAADMMRVWVNHILRIAHDIAISGNLKLFVWVCSHVILLFSLVQSFSCLFLLNVDFVHQGLISKKFDLLNIYWTLSASYDLKTYTRLG
uniref:Reticulon-like protein n=1 Tax=Nicotiana sylvestris TaxID=4096 RepID=A0A1U7VHM5_NICSY|nr:PREDICTED: reticulon-like protein B11 [Nicotiana sylvestris]